MNVYYFRNEKMAVKKPLLGSLIAAIIIQGLITNDVAVRKFIEIFLRESLCEKSTISAL